MSNLTKHGFIQPIEDEQYNISIFNENFEKLDQIITNIYATITNKPGELKTEISKLVSVGTQIDKDAPKNASLLELIRWIDSTVGKEVSLINQYVTKKEFNIIIKKYITKLESLRYKLTMLENILTDRNYIHAKIYDFTDNLDDDLINSAEIFKSSYTINNDKQTLSDTETSFVSGDNLYNADKIFAENNPIDCQWAFICDDRYMQIDKKNKQICIWNQNSTGCSGVLMSGNSHYLNSNIYDKENKSFKIKFNYKLDATNNGISRYRYAYVYFNFDAYVPVDIEGVIVVRKLSTRIPFNLINSEGEGQVVIDADYYKLIADSYPSDTANIESYLGFTYDEYYKMLTRYDDQRIIPECSITYELNADDKEYDSSNPYYIVFEMENAEVYVTSNTQQKLNGDSMFNGRNVYGFKITNTDTTAKEYLWKVKDIAPGKYTLYVDYYGNNAPKTIYRTNCSDLSIVDKLNCSVDYSEDYPYIFFDVNVTKEESEQGFYLSVLLDSGESYNVCMHLLKNYDEEYLKIIKILDGLFTDGNIDADKIKDLNKYIDDINKYLFGANGTNINAQEKINILDKYYMSISNLYTFIKDDVYTHGSNLINLKEIFNYFDLIVRALEFKIISYFITIDDMLRKTIDLHNILNPSVRSYTVDCYGEWSGDDAQNSDYDIMYSLTDSGCDKLGEFAYDYNDMNMITNTSYHENNLATTKNDADGSPQAPVASRQTHNMLQTSYAKCNDIIINTRKGRSLINAVEDSNGNIKLTLNDFTIFVEDYSDNVPKVKPIKITKDSVKFNKGNVYNESGVLYDSSKINYKTDELDKCGNTGTYDHHTIINKTRQIMNRLASTTELGRVNKYDGSSNLLNQPIIWVDSMYVNIELSNNSASVKLSVYPTPYSIAYIKIMYKSSQNDKGKRIYNNTDGWYNNLFIAYYTNSQKYNVFNYSFDVDDFDNQSYIGSIGSKIFYLDSDKNLLSKYRLMNINQSNLNISENNVIYDEAMHSHVDIQYVSKYDKADNGNYIDHMMIAYNNSHLIPAFIRGKLYYVDLGHSTYDMYIEHTDPKFNYSIVNSDSIVSKYTRKHINYNNTSINVSKLLGVNGAFFVLCINEDDLTSTVITPHIKFPLIDDFNSDKMIVLHIGRLWHTTDINDTYDDGLVSYPWDDNSIKWISQWMGGCTFLKPRSMGDSIEQYKLCIEHDSYSDMVSFVHNNYDEGLTTMADGSYNTSRNYPKGNYSNGINSDEVTNLDGTVTSGISDINIKSDILHYIKDTDTYYRYNKYDILCDARNYNDTIDNAKTYIMKKYPSHCEYTDYCMIPIGWNKGDNLPESYGDKDYIPTQISDYTLSKVNNDALTDAGTINIDITDIYPSKYYARSGKRNSNINGYRSSELSPILFSLNLIDAYKNKYITAVNKVNNINHIVNDIDMYILDINKDLYKLKDEFIEVNPVTAKSLFLTNVNEATNKVLSDINLDDSAYEIETTDIVYDNITDAINSYGSSINGINPSNPTYEGRKGILESQIFGVKNASDGSIDKYKYNKWEKVGTISTNTLYSARKTNSYDSTYCEYSFLTILNDINFTDHIMKVYSNKNSKYLICTDDVTESGANHHHTYLPFGRLDVGWGYDRYQYDHTKDIYNFNEYEFDCLGSPVALFFNNFKAPNNVDQQVNNSSGINQYVTIETTDKTVCLNDYVDNFGNKKPYYRYDGGKLTKTNDYGTDKDYKLTLNTGDLVVCMYTDKVSSNSSKYKFNIEVWKFTNKIVKVEDEQKYPDMSAIVNSITDKCKHAFGVPYTMTNLYMYENAIVKNLNDNLQKLIDDGVIIDTGKDTWVSEVFTNVKCEASCTRKNPGGALFYVHEKSKQLDPFFNGTDKYLLKVEYSPIDGETIGTSSQVELTTLVINLSAFNQCRIDDIRSKDPFLLDGYIDTRTGKYYHSKKVQSVINDINDGYTSISILSPKPMWNKDPYRAGVFDPYPFRYRELKQIINEIPDDIGK